jgi:4-hydroxy-tetrahydrodipicolinate synthase
MVRSQLKGVFAQLPLVLKDNQEIDYEGIRENIAFLQENGIHGFIAFTTRGQFYGVTEKEFDRVTNACVDAAGKSTCVIGTTWKNTQTCERRTKYAEDAGADAVLVGIPFEKMPCIEGVVEHYRMIDEVVDNVPIMIWNNTVLHRNFSMTLGFWKKNLLGLNNVKALYDRSDKSGHLRELVAEIGNEISVFEDETVFFYDAISNPQVELSMVTMFGLAAPKLILQYYEACRQGKIEGATKLMTKLTEGYFGILPSFIEGFAGDFSLSLNNSLESSGSIGYAYTVYEAAYLNAISEIGGNRAGPPRKPYRPLPQEYRSKLEDYIRGLQALEH